MERRETEEHIFDFVVVGGGTAGLAAAIAAARRGAKSAIIQDRPVFGGNSSSEIRVAPLGSASFNGWSRETGLLEEWLTEERARNHDGIYDGMANSHYDIVLWEAAKAERNLTTFINCSIRGVKTEEGVNGERRITALHGSQLASEKEYIFKASQFADCTGDATVGALAGADFRYGRDSREEFDEPMAPIKADEQTMGSTLTMRARDIGKPVAYTPPNWAKEYHSLEDIGVERTPGRFNRVDYGGYWWIEIGSPYHQIADNQTIRDELLAHVLGVWNYIKNYSEDKEAANTYALEWVGMLPGKRESRRLMGDVLVNEHDCHTDRVWPDRVCYAGWFIDVHIMGGILNKKEPGELAHSDQNYRHWTRIAPFSLPLRALYSRNITNLWMAGRNISVTHVALGATRVMMTHALQGQAIGTAAAYAVSVGLTPRQAADPEGGHVGPIQQLLLRDDVHIPALCNTDPDDLALKAAVSADSDAPLDFGDPLDGHDLELTVPLSQIFPVTGDRIDTVSVFLRNRTGNEITVKGELFQQERIWDRKNGSSVARLEFPLSVGEEKWCTTEVNVRVEGEHPFRLMLDETPGVLWARASLYPTGTVTQHLYTCLGGCDPGNEHMNSLQPHETAIPPYELWTQHRRQAQAVRIEPPPRPFGPANVNNGYAWPLEMPNLWVSNPSRPLPQSLTLELKEVSQFNTAVISFDTHLDHTYHSMGPYWLAPSCARDWNLYARVNGEWQQVHTEKGNYLRRRTVMFDQVKADGLKLEILSTNIATAEERKEKDPERPGLLEQARSARVYELRIYNSQ